MKKLGILTLVFYNYGTRLQSYALAKVINSLFPDELHAEIINTEGLWSERRYIHKYLLRNSLKSYGLYSIFHLLSIFRFIMERRKMIKNDFTEEIDCRRKAFDNFISQIPYSEYYSFNDIRAGCLADYDLLLVGSDQVWNVIKVGAQDIYLLDFWNKGKGLTYAASFGFETLPDEFRSHLNTSLTHFSDLLIREESGVRICNMLGYQNARRVIDPTMLLCKSDYCQLADDSYAKGDYVLVYSLNMSYNIFTEANRLAKKLGCKMVVLKRSICPPDISLYQNAEELFSVSPEGFLGLIENAKCVVTNSYHALLFSIIFNVDFYLYLDKSEEENSRLLTIVNMCGLEDRVVYYPKHLPTDCPTIDYANCNKTVIDERLRSVELLKNSINRRIH